LRELLIRALLLFQRLVQQRCRLGVTELFGECAEGAVERDLVVLRLLRRGDEAGVAGILVEAEVDDVLTLGDDALHRFAGVRPGFAADLRAHALQPLDLLFSLFQV
jgi:hypothetical protein